MQIVTFKNIFNTREKKKLLSNFFSLSVLQLIGYLFPLITTPYLAKIIGVDGFGSIAFAASIIAYFQTFTDWGFRYIAVRDIAVYKNDIEKVSSIFCNVLAIKTLFAIISALILSVLIYYIPLFAENKKILWVTFLLIPGYILFPDWLFQAMEEMKYITILNFFSKLIFTCFVFIFIKTKDDFILEPLFIACGYLLSGIIGIIYAFKRFKIHFVLTTKSECYKMIKRGYYMFQVQFLPTLYNNLSVILLQNFSGAKATGIFNGGYKFINMADQFSNVVSRTFFPFLARKINKHKKFAWITCCISLLMSIFLFLFSDLIVDVFYTSEFDAASTVIKIMSISPFFLFLMQAYGTNGLVLIHKESILRNIIVLTSIIGLILSVVLIYLYSYLGVAITLTTVWGIRGLLTFIYAKKYGL